MTPITIWKNKEEQGAREHAHEGQGQLIEAGDDEQSGREEIGWQHQLRLTPDAAKTISREFRGTRAATERAENLRRASSRPIRCRQAQCQQEAGGAAGQQHGAEIVMRRLRARCRRFKARPITTAPTAPIGKLT